MSIDIFSSNYFLFFCFLYVVIETPEGIPGSVDSLECYPMGSSALLLAWKPPQEINGVLTGYRIYYQEVTGESELGSLKERHPKVKDSAGKAKLAGLNPHSKYRVTIKATTRAGEGIPYYTGKPRFSHYPY